jgi:hypothetical protein
MKHSRESNNGKYINSYLSSVNATPTAASNLRQSITKAIPKDDPLLKEFSKNFYNQIGYNPSK